jgi:hypothetical protein
VVTLRTAPTLPRSVPWNAEVGLATTGEMRLAKLPLGLNSDSWADFWKPEGQASVVDHVGVTVAAPLVGVKTSLPGWEPWADAAAAEAAPAESRLAPMVKPVAARIKAPCRTLPAVRQLTFV